MGKHYINSKDFSRAVVEYQLSPDNEKLHDLLEKYFQPLCLKVAETFFRDEALSFEDMASDALVVCWQTIHKFSPGKIAKNGQEVTAFQYFTSVARNAIRGTFRDSQKHHNQCCRLSEKIINGDVSRIRLGKLIGDNLPEDMVDEE